MSRLTIQSETPPNHRKTGTCGYPASCLGIPALSRGICWPVGRSCCTPRPHGRQLTAPHRKHATLTSRRTRRPCVRLLEASAPADHDAGAINHLVKVAFSGPARPLLGHFDNNSCSICYDTVGRDGIVRDFCIVSLARTRQPTTSSQACFCPRFVKCCCRRLVRSCTIISCSSPCASNAIHILLGVSNLDPW